MVLDTDFDCINISGFKKLNGNQILPEDISYILNDLKLKIIESEKDKSIAHLFNTKFEIDKKTIDSLLPHRKPMLLIDKLVNIVPLKSATAIMYVK